MLKKLFILLLITLGLYVLVQIPVIGKQVDVLKASLFSKWNNVATEYTRVKGEVDDVKATVNDIKEKVGTAKENFDEFKGKVVETKDAVVEAADKVNKVVDAFGDDQSETESDKSGTSE